MALKLCNEFQHSLALQSDQETMKRLINNVNTRRTKMVVGERISLILCFN